MGKVICFGEIMLRLSPPGYLRFVQTNSFDLVYGGGEANVSVSLAHFGIDTAFVTKVPDNPMGQAAFNELRRYGVDTQYILQDGERLGIYFLEKGASQRPSKVVYDRKYSAFSQLKAGDFNWTQIFQAADWFHFTGITPALGDNVADQTLEACRIAKENGLTISCDLNYRKNLWSTGKAGQVMSKLMPYVDLCIVNEEDAEKVFGIKAPDSDIANGKLKSEGYQYVALELKKKFGFKKVAVTLRSSISASDNHWAGMYYDGNDCYFSRSYPVHIIDRVGGGDSFAAGLIYALLNEFSPREIIEFAASASCLKHSVEGDFNQVNLAEVMTLMKGDLSGRVER
jgi:2-dehydro-3-deoxygluconokinase